VVSIEYLGRHDFVPLLSSFVLSLLVRRNLHRHDLQAVHSDLLFQLRESRAQLVWVAKCIGTRAYEYWAFLWQGPFECDGVCFAGSGSSGT